MIRTGNLKTTRKAIMKNKMTKHDIDCVNKAGGHMVDSPMEAIETIKSLGHTIDKALELPVYTRDESAGRMRRGSGIHVHFMNPEGLEIGFYTPILGTLMVFPEPKEMVGEPIEAYEEFPTWGKTA
jgi:hypothetical protein